MLQVFGCHLLRFVGALVLNVLMVSVLDFRLIGALSNPGQLQGHCVVILGKMSSLFFGSSLYLGVLMGTG